MILSVILSLFVTTSVFGDNVRIKCDGTPFTPKFKHLFSLDIYLDEDSQIHLGRGEEPKVTDVARINVLEKHGSLAKDKPELMATLVVDRDCSLVKRLKCEINGYHNQEADFKKIRFEPRIQDDETKRSGIIHQYKKTIYVDEASLVQCSADVSTNHTNWSWQVMAPGAMSYILVHQDSVQTFPSEEQQCHYNVSSRLIYINKEPGEIRFRCLIEEKVVGEISALVRIAGFVDKTPELLSVLTFLSAVIFVYTHFILLPCVFSKWDRIFNYREKDLLLKWRAFISLIISVVFLICGGITCAVYREADYMKSHLAFVVMEFVLIFMYAALRFFSNYKRETKKQQKGLLNNARVSTSFGAVLLPVTCWLIIRIQGGGWNIAFDVFFCFISFGALVFFVCVSFTREGKYWDEKLT